MARKQRYTVNEVRDALTKANGFYSKAAESLGCDIRTIQNYINRYDELAQAIKDVRHKRDDFVETMFMKGIQEGNPTLIIFYLKTQMRSRGYSDKDTTNDNTLKIEHSFVDKNDTDLDFSL